MVIDTPGFDDSMRTDSQILEEISRILTAQHEAGVPLKGVIYLHRITDVRYARASVKTLEIFKKICGSLALKNVMLVSTRWNEVDEALGVAREQQLKDDFWAYMLGHGSTMARFQGSRESAIAIASQLVSRQSIVLELQRELIDERKTLKQTVAGTFVSEDLADLKKQSQKDLEEIDVLRQTLRENDRALKRKCQQDWEREQARLVTARQDEDRLRKEIAAEVHAEIEGKKGKKGKGLFAALPFIPAVVGILGMFVGIPPGTTGLLSDWFSESGLMESVSEFFANF